jgi:penicillin-binding protein 1A
VVKKILSKRLLKWGSILLLSASACALIAGYFVYRHISATLPDIMSLHDVQYQIPLSIYSKDKLLIAQFGEKQRIPVKMKEIPVQLVNAFLAAEDDNFFEHNGVDFNGLMRASAQFALTGQKRQGGSTITMQVTRNFLLNNEKTFTRKLKEIILALKIDSEFSKDEIMELYLNQIFMGHRAYGIAAAAQTYYGKALSELTLAEQAMLAGLPKAPSAYNPITNEERALQRRNYVLRRMAELGYITQQAADYATDEPSTAKLQYVTPELSAPYLSEMVRQQLFEQYGEGAYTSGFKVYTTIDSKLQNTANQALSNSLHHYDQRHRSGSASVKINTKDEPFSELPVIGDTLPAIVTKVVGEKASVQLQNNDVVEVSAENGVKKNDVVRVRQLASKNWTLTRVPKVEGAFVALNPSDGAILALTGGFDFSQNKYNRATQSKRQPGSGFKPIVYTTALEEGYTAASIINDSPIVVENAGQEDEWRPENYSKRFYGATTLRTALTYSRNIVSIRLLKEMGVEKVIATGLRFGFTEDQLPKALSLALGSGYASPLDMARMYATFANGGFAVKPFYIERIESSNGEVVFQAKPKVACPECDPNLELTSEYAPRIISPRISFIMNSMLRDVVQKGTATAAKVLGRDDLAGKTGTTNEQRDAWFNGFTPHIVATAWVGHDNFSPLGGAETGGVAALPMWVEFMRTALKDVPEVPLESPEGIVKAFINPRTGYLLSAGSRSGAWEYFQAELTPVKRQPVVRARVASSSSGNGSASSSASKRGGGESATEKPIESLF